MGYVYVLQSENCTRYYIGSTVDPKRRILEHNLGKVKATKSKGPWQIVLLQQYYTITQARQVEYKIKQLKSRKILEMMIRDQKIRIQ